MVKTIQQGELPSGAESLLNAAVASLLRERGVRHAVLGVESGDRSFRWIGAAGVADESGHEMAPDTPYCLASVTKLYVGAAILRLEEQGRLSLDDPLTRHLPADLLDGLHQWRGEDRTADLTIRHLMGHASGLPEYLSEAPKGQDALLDRVVKQDLSWGVADIVEMTRSAKGAHFPPRPFDGKRHTIRYSDTNFQLLIAVIERASDLSIHEVFSKLIYQPMGLTRTWHPGTPQAADIPFIAAIWAGEKLLQRPLALASFQDLYSTADETLRFLRALISGELFDKPETALIMRQHWNPLAFSLVPTSPGWPIEYGLAMMRFQVPRLLKPFISAPTLIGHSGATGSWLFYAPGEDLFVTGTVNQMTAAAVPYKRLPKLVQQLSRPISSR